MEGCYCSVECSEQLRMRQELLRSACAVEAEPPCRVTVVGDARQRDF